MKRGERAEDGGFEEWWRELAPHLTMARVDAMALVNTPPDTPAITRMYYKARRGWFEHGGAIRDMDDAAVQAEADAEVDDLTVYLAALRARRYKRMRQISAF